MSVFPLHISHGWRARLPFPVFLLRAPSNPPSNVHVRLGPSGAGAVPNRWNSILGVRDAFLRSPPSTPCMHSAFPCLGCLGSSALIPFPEPSPLSKRQAIARLHEILHGAAPPSVYTLLLPTNNRNE
ncbi:unnamed protein product [Periconia digitata]|uniref:Uncharacterized protein n=1 Tax=Periconia digitata TaxID=1303443 RepID=A0A9W4U365_9PLEO|nr:unnamed protein product [Periconia digitata]